MKVTLRELFHTALENLSLDSVMRSKITCSDRVVEVGGERIELATFKKILVVAVGKAASRMTGAFCEIVAPEVVSGVVVAPASSSEPVPHAGPAEATSWPAMAAPPGAFTLPGASPPGVFTLPEAFPQPAWFTPSAAPQPPRHFMAYTGGHPYPDATSLYSASVVHELLDDLKPYYLVVYLLSGGGSALCERPVSDAIPLEDVREFYRLLVTCGANIVEMNVLRKHLSAIKGGRLAERAHPARQVTLYVSDVPPGQPSTVASGPTMPDESTSADCYELAERLKLIDRFPASIRKMFEDKTIPETPKPGAAAFSNSSWHCLLDNQAAIDELAAAARARQWHVEVDLSVDDWPVAKAANHLLRRLERMRQQNPGRTVALLTGGELSCPVTGDGQGGRNQAFVLDCVPKIADKNMAVISAGTDGIDGNSPAAGAVADSASLERARDAGLDAEHFQRRSDSFHFFEALGDALKTGPTGNNVRDIRMLVAW